MAFGERRRQMCISPTYTKDWNGYQSSHSVVGTAVIFVKVTAVSPKGEHLIFYLIREVMIDIIGVVHKEMDIGGYFEL